MLLTFAGAEVVLGVTACASRTSTSHAPSTADSVQVGFGAQPKDKMTGAVSTVSESDITARPLRIEELLRGKIPGLVINGTGNSLTLRLRGTNSLMLEQEPLVIVDDVAVMSGNIANALAGLTPDDIKQVSVLKDVSSTSIYGSRGAGGVILIRTKAKPDSGERNHK
jgi:TonB-dependent SusC/RagA subfamily outer membrane receptor